ncbi:MAG: U32 family peptidase C-terminal domain-containing protein [Alphaproteobacteria bacterium]|nr:U32 family peptidase C-terminal domain-containing protein [Alphaproteobacteria bacterium]
MLGNSELLLPAGSLSRLKTAFLYGADAVYAGAPDLSLRAHSEFPLQELSAGISYAHGIGKKVYLTLNLFTHNPDVAKLPMFLKAVREASPDGLIVSDPGVFAYMKEHAPDIPLHISTQANVCSWLTVKFWQDMGAKMCVLGREVSFAELTEIRKLCPDIRLEMFIHGAMCMSYSGRCLLSSFMASRPANKGQCAHSCRWKYKVYLEEEERPGAYIPIEEDDKGTYLMNSKDLCLLPHLDKILTLGIDSLKIEGRNKSDYYVAMTTRVYRRAIDAWRENPEAWQADTFMAELETMQSRGYTQGFFFGMPEAKDYNYTTTLSTGNALCVGSVAGFTENALVLEVRNRICQGDEIEFLSPYRFDPIRVKMTKVIDARNETEVPKISAGKAGQSILIPYDFFALSDIKTGEVQKLLPPLTVVRRKV